MSFLPNLKPNRKDKAGSCAWIMGGSTDHPRASRCRILPILGRKGGADRPCEPLAKHCGLHKYSHISYIISK